MAKVSPSEISGAAARPPSEAKSPSAAGAARKLPIEEMATDDDDELPPLEPIPDSDDDDELPPLEPIPDSEELAEAAADAASGLDDLEARAEAETAAVAAEEAAVAAAAAEATHAAVEEAQEAARVAAAKAAAEAEAEAEAEVARAEPVYSAHHGAIYHRGSLVGLTQANGSKGLTRSLGAPGDGKSITSHTGMSKCYRQKAAAQLMARFGRGSPKAAKTASAATSSFTTAHASAKIATTRKESVVPKEARRSSTASWLLSLCCIPLAAAPLAAALVQAGSKVPSPPCSPPGSPRDSPMPFGGAFVHVPPTRSSGVSSHVHL